MQDTQKLNYGKTFLIGLGFFASSLAWSLYNAFVPVFLAERFPWLTTTLIGMIMTIDNVFGVIFQPVVGQLSDRTRTRIGRRLPYILVGIPVCALLFAFIPRMRALATMMAVIIGFNFVMSVWRSPVVSLMPDLTPSKHRSKANGVINLMGGLGGILAFLVGGRLQKLGGDNAPFLMGAIVMVLALVLLMVFIREPDSRQLSLSSTSDRSERRKWLDDLRQDFLAGGNRSRTRSLILILLAIFFWFCGFNAVETFFTLYATQTLGIGSGDAAMMLAFFSVSLVAFAIPAGLLASRFGRRRMILLGLIGLVLVFLPMLILQDASILRILLLIGGVFWAMININSLPMVVELAGHGRIGSFTGYYYFFSFSAAIVSPILFGAIRDLTQDYRWLFIYSAAAFVIALLCMLFVRHGESGPAPAQAESSPEGS